MFQRSSQVLLKVPVPIYVGALFLEKLNYVTLTPVSCACDTEHCACKSAPEGTEQGPEKMSRICRCGEKKSENKEKQKLDNCSKSKRCRCFVNGVSCSNCKCQG